MPEAAFDSIPSPDNGLFGWMEDTNRFRVNTNTPGFPTYENLAYTSDLDLITLQVAYDNSPGGNINLDLGSPFALSGNVAGFLMPRMTQTEFDNIPSPNKGLIGYTTDFNRFRVNTNAASPVYEDIAYLSDVNSIDLQTAYDNSVDGNVDLSVGKPFKLSSLVAGFLMPRMTELQFNQIVNPDAGLLAYVSDNQRFRTNIGSPHP
jgi:hypothetical protein